MDRRLVFAFAALATAAFALAPACTKVPATSECGKSEDPGSLPRMKILSLNVGNGDQEGPYALRMRDQAYEDFVAAQIQSRGLDVIALEEVLQKEVCLSFEETDPSKTCFDAANRDDPVRRLVGPDYTIACDANHHVECVAVRTSFGTIRGLDAGALSVDGADTAELPGAPCDWKTGECNADPSACDAESSVSTVVVDTSAGPFRIVHAHPSAGGADCRAKQVAQAFGFADSLPTILLGDWNFEPDQPYSTSESAVWNAYVGSSERFHEHAELDQGCQRVATRISTRSAFDLVVSDFLVGRCDVVENPAIDDGFDFTSLAPGGDYPARLDHRAVSCSLGARWPS